MNKALCIYHGNCADGFGAAWVFHKKDDEYFDFHAGTYSKPPPDCAGRDVYLVDFSYKQEVVLDILKVAKKVIFIDHHKTAIEDLAPLITAGKIIAFISKDNSNSGAMLAWEYWFGIQTPAPALLRHIEDRDLWRFSLPGTRNIQASLFSFPYDFEVWDRLMAYSEEELVSSMEVEGMGIERKHFKDIAELIEVGARRMTIGGIDVPVVNLPYTMSSDAGHILAKGEPFAACYSDTKEGRYFSLRSEEGGMDVSQIALKYGGGGHARAAGFTVPFDHWLCHGS